MTTSTAQALDQYYTAPSVAQSLYQTLLARLGRKAKGLTFVEPSAGAGAFFQQFPAGSIGLDLDPRCDGAAQADFFEWTPVDPAAPMAFVGNPPFGHCARLAVKFFNRAASFPGTKLIAFVVPRSFEKDSTQRRLDRAFRLVHQEVLPENAFVFNGTPYDVPCAWMVWERLSGADAAARDTAPVEVVRTHPDFRLLEGSERLSADFAVQRVGVNAGAVKDMAWSLGEGSHYFVRASDRYEKNTVRATFERLHEEGAWDAVKFRTAGNPSIAKSELVAGYAGALPKAAPTVFERLNDLHDESGISAEERRAGGVVYTGSALARSMVRMARLEPSDRVLEPSVGRGVFLWAIVEHWVHERGWTYQQTATWAEHHLFAQDIDGRAIADVARLWTSYFAEHGVVSDLRPNLRVGDALTQGFSSERFDCVLGNPPYVRTTAMTNDYRDMLRDVFPASCGKGNADMYYAFIELALRQGARSVLVVPKSWMSNRHAAGVRALLRDRVRAVIDFQMRLIFGTKAATYASIIVTGPVTCAPLLYRENLPEEGETPWTVFFRDKTGPLDDTGWYFGEDRDLDGLLRGAVDGPTLNDIAIVHSGVNTSADGAFLVKDGKVDGERVHAVDRTTGKTVSLPLALTPRFLKLNRLRNRAKLDASTDRMIAPYDAAWRLVPENRLGAGVHGWLNARRDRLDARKTKGIEDWYAFGRRAGMLTLDLDQPVLLVTCWPCEPIKAIRITPREISPDGRFLFVGGFVVQPRDPADIDRVQRVVESETAWRAIHRYGRAKKSTRPYHTYTAALLRLVPVREEDGAAKSVERVEEDAEV
ncbi:TPA: Eco57I restriction-modification methylase domain-containing protein [Burkholderia vietnamiensis]|nr:Eco57I restriction-modification methylase domain-containing protein [Burkholderia vietnamiensis]